MVTVDGERVLIGKAGWSGQAVGNDLLAYYRSEGPCWAIIHRSTVKTAANPRKLHESLWPGFGSQWMKQARLSAALLPKALIPAGWNDGQHMHHSRGSLLPARATR